MGIFLYLVIFSGIVPFVNLVSWPLEGCRIELDTTTCYFNVYCKDYVNVNNQHFEINNIANNYDGMSQYDYFTYCSDNNGVYSVDGYRYAKVNMYYNIEYNDTLGEIPTSQNRERNRLPMIITLNLTINEYTVTPNLCNMVNLKYLSMTYNNLNTVKLYNTNELAALEELDLSHNKIRHLDGKGHYAYKNLTTLILSHNSLTELPDAVLDEFKQLKILDLSYNSINQIKMTTFEGIKHLISLYLSNNEITEINSSLFRFNELKVLDLSYNRLKTIKTSDFIALKQLEVLNLSFNAIINVDKMFLNTMLNLNDLDMRSNTLEVIDEVIFINNTNLKKVDFAENKLKNLPKDLFKNSQTSVFYIEGNILEGSLVRGMFEGLSLVRELDFSYQMLTSVDDYAFFGLQKLEHLLLNNNNISSLSKNCFKTLRDLQKLDLSNNRITAINFEKDDLISLRVLLLRDNLLTHIIHEDFSHLNALEHLYLTDNNITEIDSNVFKSLQDVKSLEIWNNPLSGAVNEGMFEGLRSLPSLDISSTRFTIIKNGSFNGMVRLKILNVSHSRITELQYNSFSQADALESIDLSYNGIETFSVNSTHLSNLTTLLLNNNKLKAINSDYFRGLFRLYTINLASNNIEIINTNSFYDQKYLDHLDLSYNTKMKFTMSLIGENKNLVSLILSGIQSGIVFTEKVYTPLKVLELSDCNINNLTSLNLKALSYLEKVVLKNNKIEIITETAFSKVYNLNILDLSFNKINIIKPGVFIDNSLLSSLNVSHNVLSTLSYGVFLGLSNLQFLDISYNKITDLKSERFNELHNLAELIADSNKIESFDAESFMGTKLVKLSIGDNPLPCEMIVRYLRKTELPFIITAINKMSNQVNHHGITCNEKHPDYSPVSKKDFNTSSENINILIDIKEILERLATDMNTQRHFTNNDAENRKTIIDQIDQLSSKYYEKLSLLSNFSFIIAKESNITNILLQKMLKVLTVANTFNKQTTPVPFTKDNATFENFIQYFNKMKQDLEDIIESEKQGIVNDLNSKLAAINSHVDSILSTNTPVTEKLEKSDEGNQSQSIFTETCVALILVILVCYVLLQLYKSKLFVRPRRSYSTRELPGSMESPNL